MDNSLLALVEEAVTHISDYKTVSKGLDLLSEAGDGSMEVFRVEILKVDCNSGVFGRKFVNIYGHKLTSRAKIELD